MIWGEIRPFYIAMRAFYDLNYNKLETNASPVTIQGKEHWFLADQ